MYKEVLKSVFINSLINLGMAYAVFRSVESIRFWGAGGLFMDLAATVVLMPFLMTLVMTKVLEAQNRKNRLPAISRESVWHRVWRRHMPRALPVRGLFISGVALVILLPATTLGLLLWGQFPMSLKAVVWLKAVFGGGIAALVTPLIVSGVLPAQASSAAIGTRED